MSAVMDRVDRNTRSRMMQGIRDRNTVPELLVRQALNRRGIKYRLNATNLPGRPDIINRKRQLAIQVRGCFWHQHSCKNGHLPKSRTGYWHKKLLGNVARDKTNDQFLRKMGFKLFIIWECWTKDYERINRSVDKISKEYFKANV